mgnify:CR=1 FL=1
MILSGFVLISCSNDKKEKIENKEAVEHKEHAHDMDGEAEDHGYEMALLAYQCPMKCEGDKSYDEEGACPECKMDLKKIEVSEHTDTKKENSVE